MVIPVIVLVIVQLSHGQQGRGLTGRGSNLTGDLTGRGGTLTGVAAAADTEIRLTTRD